MRRDNDYMAWCEFGAQRFSTCSRAQYMAIILDAHGRVIGTGYNGSPPGFPHCIDGGCPHALEGGYEERCVAIHAEENALLWSNRSDRVGGTLYVNGVPCYDCAKKLCGSGIVRVVYRMGKEHQGWREGLALMRSAGLVVDELE